MRVRILRALLMKEIHRHVANRGGIALGVLLVAAAVLLSAFDPGAAAGPGGNGGGIAAGMVGGVHHCYVEHGDSTPLVERLKANVPDAMRQQVVFRQHLAGRQEGLIAYPPGVGGIHIRPGTTANGGPALSIQIWHPAGDPGAMAPFEQWVWKEARLSLREEAVKAVRAAGGNPDALPEPDFNPDDGLWAVRESFRTLATQADAARGTLGRGPTLPAVTIGREGLGGKVLDIRSAVATGMVVFALYFACVYLLPTLNCEERERGVLLAQALSPASPAEILAAKFLFYPVMGIGLAGILAGIYKPAVLSSLFFWLSLVAVATGFLGIGMTIATLARTQRAAFMGGMCYLLSVSLILFICSTNGIAWVPNFAVEYHGPRILHAALSGDVQSGHWLHLLAAMGLGAAWVTAAGYLFRRRGWQ